MISTEQRTDSFSPLRILHIASWVGLLTGLLEAAFQVGWRQTYKGYRISLSPHALWMAPVAELIIFTLLGGFLALLFWRLPRLFTLRIILFVLALFSFLALLLLLPQLHIYVKWLLAIGLAVQITRFVGKRQNGFYQLVRSTSVWLVAVVAALAIGTFTWETVRERRAIAKLPPPVSELAPNVILITLDTVRANSLSLYGYERKTSPQLDKLAKDSIVFDNAIAPSSWTFPSHASMFTGRHPSELGVGWTGSLDGTYRTLAEELGSRGYESAGFVANYLYCSSEIGINRGMVHYEDYPVSVGQTFLSSSLGQAISMNSFIRNTVNYHDMFNRKSAAELNADFLDWLSSRDQNRPFYAFLNYFDAHEPLLPPKPFNEQFGPTRTEASKVLHANGGVFSGYRHFSESDIQKFRNAYDSSIAYLDHQLGELFANLSKKGVLENTVVIITSDHGELLGEHGIFSHGNNLYIQTLRVPLLIRYPSRVPRNRRISHPVNLRDLPATILDFLGEKDQNIFPGKSLGRYINETSNETVFASEKPVLSELVKSSWVEEWYPASKGDMQSIVTNEYHYIRNGDGSEEIYDRKKDPNELQNLTQTEEAQKALEEFRSALKDNTFFK